MNQVHQASRISKLRTALVIVGALVFLIAVIFGPYLAAAKASQTSALLKQIAANQARITQVEHVLQQVTGQPAQQRQAQQLEHLVDCLYNRIDYDTGHIRALDSSCALNVIIPSPPG